MGRRTDSLPATPTRFVVSVTSIPAVTQSARPLVQPTGVDYLGLVGVQHAEQTLGAIAFRQLAAVSFADAEHGFVVLGGSQPTGWPPVRPYC